MGGGVCGVNPAWVGVIGRLLVKDEFAIAAAVTLAVVDVLNDVTPEGGGGVLEICGCCCCILGILLGGVFDGYGDEDDRGGRGRVGDV